MKIVTIFEDNHLMVVVKPQGVPVQKDSSADPDLQTAVMDLLKNKYNKPGNVFLGIVHRLDRPVGGAVVFAKTSKAASRLSEQIRQNIWKKQYIAIVDGVPACSGGTLEDYLIKNSDANMVSVVDSSIKGAKKAVLKYSVIDKNDKKAILSIDLVTGRSHQIRVQLASRGWPIMNDHRYNSKAVKGGNIMLWSHIIEIKHPVSGNTMQFKAEVPEIFNDIIRSGG